MSYTFKDDGSSLTYYREYNKEVGTGDKTLIGNWVEERALRDVVDTGRYKLWVDPMNPGNISHKSQTFTKFTTRPDVHGTYQRTVVHSDHTPSAEYITSNNVPDPGYSVYVKQGKGAREALLEERARQLAAVRAALRSRLAPTVATVRVPICKRSAQAEARVLHPQMTEPFEPELPPQYQTTYRQDFSTKDLPEAETLGRRVMMTQNMADIKGAGDGLWRKEMNIVSRNLVVEETHGAPNQIVTSLGVKTGTDFGKDATFSCPIHEYKKGEEKD